MDLFDIAIARKLSGGSGGGGGGGSSDFSTAEVTVINSIESQDINYAITISWSGDYLETFYTTDPTLGPDTVTAVLYKGTATWVITTGVINVTGDATMETSPVGEKIITITGDCTITIS